MYDFKKGGIKLTMKLKQYILELLEKEELKDVLTPLERERLQIHLDHTKNNQSINNDYLIMMDLQKLNLGEEMKFIVIRGNLEALASGKHTIVNLLVTPLSEWFELNLLDYNITEVSEKNTLRAITDCFNYYFDTFTNLKDFDENYHNYLDYQQIFAHHLSNVLLLSKLDDSDRLSLPLQSAEFQNSVKEYTLLVTSSHIPNTD